MPQAPASTCFICEGEATTTGTVGYMGTAFECPACGIYEVPMTTQWETDLTAEQRAGLAGFLRHRAIRELPPVIITNFKSDDPRGAVSIEDALSTVPRRLDQIHDALLCGLARLAGGYGRDAELTTPDAALAYTLDPAVLRWHLGQLREQGFLDDGRPQGRYGLSRRGWARVEDLQRGTPERPTQAFVAMWFDPSMDAAYADAIEPAIKAAGFEPYRIKDVEHNNKICDEILAEIRRSRFVVAEFTGNRGGVYFEAGFAMGLGLPVVWVVQEKDLEGVHFDTNHFNHVTWTDVSELKTKLERRIAATIPRPVRS